MKKTLLAAAAILAVGGLASQAQVYSQNVVGYVNLSVPSKGFSFVANQLVNGTDASQTNNDVEAVLTTGQYVSDPTGGGQCSTLYLWANGGYNIYQYFSAADASNLGIGSSAGWYDGNYAFLNVANGNAASLGQASGAFIYNNASTNINITLIGVVPQGTNVVTIAPGYTPVSVAAPISVDINSKGFVGTSDPAGGGNCTTLYDWSSGGYNIYQYFSAADAANLGIGSAAGWYDGNYSLQTVADPVGQAAFIFQPSGAPTLYWTNSFSVN